MGRLIVLALVVLAAVWLVRRALRGSSPSSRSPEGGNELIQCAKCGLHLPKADAREREGRYFCSEEHARSGPEGG